MTLYLIRKKVKKFIIFGGVKIAFICFKQLPLNIKQKLEFWYHLIDGERLLSAEVEAVSFSVNKPSHFNDTTFLESPSLLKV